jgi:hypothetical protein
MLLPIKPILDRRPRRNGTSLISIQYCFSSDKRTILYTGLVVPARYWNKKLPRISQDLPVQSVKLRDAYISFDLRRILNPLSLFGLFLRRIMTKMIRKRKRGPGAYSANF